MTSSGAFDLGLAGFWPGLRGKFVDLVVGHRGDAIQHVAQVIEGVDPESATVLDDRVEDRSCLPGVRRAHEQPVFLVFRGSTFNYNANGSRTTKTLEPSLPKDGEKDARTRTRKGANSGKNLLQNGTEAVYTYDMASRLTQISHSSGSTVLNTISYTLNRVGNRTSKSQTGTAVPGGMRTETYTFDAVDQLTRANYGTVTAGYDYDAVGNRTSVTGAVTNGNGA